MGTLFDQRKRNYWEIDDTDVSALARRAEIVSQDTGVSINQAIELNKVAEMERASNLYVSNCDALDEQLAGFGHLIEDFNRLLSEISLNLESIARELNNN